MALPSVEYPLSAILLGDRRDELRYHFRTMEVDPLIERNKKFSVERFRFVLATGTRLPAEKRLICYPELQQLAVLFAVAKFAGECLAFSVAKAVQGHPHLECFQRRNHCHHDGRLDGWKLANHFDGSG